MRSLVLVVTLIFALTAHALSTGESAPEIRSRDIAGRAFTMSSLRGRVVLVDFWATWCSPCAAEMPVLQRLHAQNEARGFTVVGVSQDRERAAVTQFVQDTHITFPILQDSDHQIAASYRPSRMPTSYLVDRRGRVRFVHTGFRSADVPVLEREIQQLLNER